MTSLYTAAWSGIRVKNRVRSSVLGLVGLVLPTLSWAEDPGRNSGLDAHGSSPVPGQVGPLDPIHVWRPDYLEKGTFVGGLTFEYGRGLLSRTVEEASGACSESGAARCQYFRELDNLVTTNVQASYVILPRLAVALDWPIFLFHTTENEPGVSEPVGPLLGDPSIHVPVGIVLPGASGEGFGLSAIPSFAVPIGAQESSVGAVALSNPTVSGGLKVAGGYGAGPVAVSGNVGFAWRGWDDQTTTAELLNIRSHPAINAGVAVGWQPIEPIGFSFETRFDKDFLGVPVDGGDDQQLSPVVELFLSHRGQLPNGFSWVAGYGRNVSPKAVIGAAAARAYAGVSFTPRKKNRGLDPVDPVLITAVTVTNANGEPISGAVVRAGDAVLGNTDAAGVLTLQKLPKRRDLVVEAEGYLSTTLKQPVPGPISVALQWPPTPVTLSIRDQQGEPVAAVVTVEGPSEVPAPVVGPDGLVAMDLPPGTWRVAVEGPGYGRQVREIVVEPRRPEIEFEALLAPDLGDGRVALVPLDVDGRPLEGARVLVNGRPVGTTATGGTLEIEGLAEGSQAVEITANGFQTAVLADLQSNDTPVAAPVLMQRSSGSVKVVVRGPDGRVVPDARVRFDGPSRLQPQEIGPSGERVFGLRPGSWQVLISSSTYGLQQRDVVVPEDDTGMIVVEAILQSTEEGLAELEVRVVDVDGLVVNGAEVRLDGKSYGYTSTGGTVKLQDLDLGVRKLEIEGDNLREGSSVEIDLVEGTQEAMLPVAWEPGTVRISARTENRAVSDATARFLGAQPMEPLILGADGEEFGHLPEGGWSVVVASPQFGLQQRKVQVPSNSSSLVSVDVVMAPPEGGEADLSLKVVDPDGHPISGATVVLDGEEFGSTTGGSLMLEDLDAGTREVEITAPLMVTKKLDLKLKSGAQESSVRLDWAPGVARISARSAAGPVNGAVVRISGETSVPATPLDASGQRLFQLSPGDWQVVVTAPGFGIAQKTISIPNNGKGVTSVVVDMAPPKPDVADLLVRVRDRDGEPVSNAEVLIGGESRGRTGTGGSLLVEGLEPGTVAAVVEANGFKPWKSDHLELDIGQEERIAVLDWVPQSVRVDVVDEKGQQLDAEVRFEGPETVAPKRIGTDGTETFTIRPGVWQVLASTGEHGMGRKEVVVTTDGSAPVVKLVLTPAKTEVTEEQVVIRDQVQFEFNEATLLPGAAAILDEVAATLIGHPEILRVEVQGHTDNVGTVEVNLVLSQARAEEVFKALVARGVAPERLFAQGYGATRPLAFGDSEAARAKNRRVQFEIVEQ